MPSGWRSPGREQMFSPMDVLLVGLILAGLIALGVRYADSE